MLARLFVILQYLLPRYALTSLVWRLTRFRAKPLKNALIRGFIRLYDVNIEEIGKSVPGDFDTFNAFFIRELASGARPVEPNLNSIVSPVDGTVSAAASVDKDSLLQAKGLSYSLEDLFAIDLDDANAYVNGSFATIYLAPYNYHRVHMPVDGELVAAHYVPGDLFSVNNATVAHVRGLFRRNERLNLHFTTRFGPAALILVGALNVGSISTPWTGEIRPRKRGVVESLELNSAPTKLAKGDLLGWFNMGSTVILLLPDAAAQWHDDIKQGKTLRMGEAIALFEGSRD